MGIEFREELDRSKIKLINQPYIFTYKDSEKDDTEIVYFNNIEDYFNLIGMDKSISEKVQYSNCRYLMFKVIVDYIFDICNMKRSKEKLKYIFGFDFVINNNYLGKKLVEDKKVIRDNYIEVLKDKLVSGESMRIIEETITDDYIIKNIKRASQELYESSIKDFDEWWKDTEKAAYDTCVDYDTFISIVLEDAEDCFENEWFTRLLIGESTIVKMIDTDKDLQDCILRDRETGKFIGLVHKELEDDLLRFIKF